MTEFIPPGTRFIALPSPFPMRRGGALVGARLAFETWGTLSATRDNAVLILPGLSPNAHAASSVDDATEGWWEGMLGPGKAIDTNRWFVICVNPLGSCKGSTGAASPHPGDGEPYRLRFPDLSIEDGADAAAHLVRALGIDRLDTVIGNSMGGMSALALLLRHPGIARRHINISGSARSLPFSIAIRSLQREAIRLDPRWADGGYSETSYPESGMRMARKLGVVTYRSAMEWDGRFGRVKFDAECREDDPFGPEFEVERYLEGHARRFVRQFDPNAYLYLSRSMDWFDAADYAPGASRGDGVDEDAKVLAALATVSLEKALAIGVHTDILFPLQQQEQIAEGLRAGGVDSRFLPLPSPQGHDAFLVDIARFGPAVREFLEA
ncbi:homoserine O-acetyltransferase [Silanimonas algicola]